MYIKIPGLGVTARDRQVRSAIYSIHSLIARLTQNFNIVSREYGSTSEGTL